MRGAGSLYISPFVSLFSSSPPDGFGGTPSFIHTRIVKFEKYHTSLSFVHSCSVVLVYCSYIVIAHNLCCIPFIQVCAVYYV